MKIFYVILNLLINNLVFMLAEEDKTKEFSLAY